MKLGQEWSPRNKRKNEKLKRSQGLFFQVIINFLLCYKNNPIAGFPFQTLIILSGYLSLRTSPALSSTVPSLTFLSATIPSPTACCPDTSNYFLCLLLSEIPQLLVLAPSHPSRTSFFWKVSLLPLPCWQDQVLCVYFHGTRRALSENLSQCVTYSSVCLTVSSGRARTLFSLCSQHQAPWCLLVYE